MKLILVIAAFASMGVLAKAEPLNELAAHMRAMSSNLEITKVKSSETTTWSEAAAGSRELRTHVIGALGLVPEVIKSMTEVDQRRAMLEYHQLMARLIYMSASLEDAFTAGQEYQSISVSREMDIQNLFHEIDKLMSYAHDRYR